MENALSMVLIPQKHTRWTMLYVAGFLFFNILGVYAVHVASSLGTPVYPSPIVDGAPVAHSSVMLTSLLAVLSSGLAVFKF